jgi:uncharacterized membrane protein YeaQ/YmgE (transglycosylase-associated protein family)
MNILAFLLVGLISGWLASVLVEGHGLGTIGDVVVGIVGAFIGGFIFSAAGIAAYGFWGSVGMALVGAIVLLFLANLFSGFRHGPRPH